MVGVRRGTGRVRTGPIEGLVGQRSDGEREEEEGGERLATREDRADELRSRRSPE